MELQSLNSEKLESLLRVYFNLRNPISPKNLIDIKHYIEDFKLDPRSRDFYLYEAGNKLFIVLGYQVYVDSAQKSGLLDGWRGWFNEDHSEFTVEIYRKDWSRPFTLAVHIKEVMIKENGLWLTRRDAMHRKAAIAIAFRACFPSLFKGYPYEESELGVNNDIDLARAKCKEVYRGLVRLSFEKEAKQFGVLIESAINDDKLNQAQKIEQLESTADSFKEMFLADESDALEPSPYSLREDKNG